MRVPETSLADLDWVPRNKLTPLTRLGLSTLGDLVRHFPRRHEDRRRFDRFPDEEMDKPVCLFGTVTKTALKRIGGWKRMVEVVIEDESAGVLGQPVTCRWFNMPYLQKMIATGDRMVVFGRPKKRGHQIVIDHPEFEVIEEEETSIHMNRIVPVHPAGDGVTPRLLRGLIDQALRETDLALMPSLLPLNKAAMFCAIHFPASFEEIEQARRELVREEFFSIQILIQSRRAAWRQLRGTSKAAPGELLDRLLQSLPFALTNSQREVIAEIRGDLAATRRMNRLLQGDVGSGKTLVALAAMLLTAEAGWQAALMAPTQILAEQHYLNFKRLLDPLGIHVALRTGSRSEDSAPLPLFAGPSGGTPEIARGDACAPENIRYTKRRLPHFERPWAKYMITFSTLNRATLSSVAKDIVLEAVLNLRTRYGLYAAVVMPDHVHLLIEPGIKGQGAEGAPVFYSLTEILHSLKSFTAHKINHLEGKKGGVWEKESFDRIIRSEEDLQEKFLYITRNPWDAGIMGPTEEYPWVWWPECKRDKGAHASPRALSGVPSENGKTAPPQIIVGTHALLYDSSEFTRLGLVVIDEQHKFGVLQRARLIERGDAPDVLVMTATPIPRTITQTLYGDLDTSFLREKPADRGVIQTAVRPTDKLPEIVDFLRKQIEKGRQAYVVYPLVEESEKLTAKSAMVEFEKWKPLLAPHSVGLIHGRLAPEEKEQVMARFRAGELAALVATTVIEVGLDVPNANIMVVENAERFGLAQLHQLRGRIGRGAHKSFCILLHDAKVEESSREKLHVLEATSDGFEIAEADLRLRGPGDLIGTAQTGLPPLRLGDLTRDAEVMREMTALAARIFDQDPALEKLENAALKVFLMDSTAKLAASAG